VSNLDTVVAFPATHPKHTTGLDPLEKCPVFARSARKRDAGKPLGAGDGGELVVEVGSVMATNEPGASPRGASPREEKQRQEQLT
jgi:hypothetical protein